MIRLRRGEVEKIYSIWSERGTAKVSGDGAFARAFPSLFAAEQHAAALVKERLAEGFTLLPGLEEAGDAVDGRHVETTLAAVTDDDTSGPHLCGRRDLAALYAGETFPNCRLPPVHLLTLDLAALEMFPDKVRALGAIHVVYSNHESCDAWSYEPMELALEAGRVRPLWPSEHICDGPEQPLEGRTWGVRLIPFDELVSEWAIRVGGRPVWWQGMEWVRCGGCARDMFYVAGIQAVDVPPDDGCGDQLLNVFVCEDCRRLSLRVQMT